MGNSGWDSNIKGLLIFLQGPAVDVIIDTGLGVCNLHEHLLTHGLISQDGTRECIAIITHNHFDHSGGARDFDNVLIHQDDFQGNFNEWSLADICVSQRILKFCPSLDFWHKMGVASVSQS